MREVRPDLYKGFQPWERVAEAEALINMMSAACLSSADAVLETGTHVLRTPDDWWMMVLGSGYRATIDQLDADAQERTRNQCLDFIRAKDIQAVEANVVYGWAIKGMTL